jgi:putative chitinase
MDATQFILEGADDILVICSPYRKMNMALATEIYSGLTDTATKYDINTVLRVAHFLAQVMHESGCFRYNEEIWRNTDAQKRYEYNKSLGNTISGDGYTYRGRGYIQLTGRANYESFAKDIGVDFLNEPDLVATSPYNMLSAGWFWDKKKLNKWADLDDIMGVTLRVNGGYNGLKDRQAILTHIKNTLNIT